MNTINGLILVDKEPDQTSFDVVRIVKRIFDVKKVGHTGTLDPIATGMLPICLGQATKLSSIIMGYTKEYDVWIRFGAATDSHDRTGEIVAEEPWQHITKQQVEEAVKEFCGTIEQLPPMFSAIKYKGRPLYWYAHQGIQFPNRKIRQVHVERFELIDWQPPRARFLVVCSQGTYVRTLAHDLGKRLNSAGIVDELRRNACGPFHVRDALTPSALAELDMEELRKRVLTMNESLPQLPGFRVTRSLAKRIQAGRPLMFSDLVRSRDIEDYERMDLFKVTDPTGDLVALASLSAPTNKSGSTRPLNNCVVKTHKVFAP